MSILLVDDEVELSTPLSHALKREGYQVEVAYDGKSALQAIHHQQSLGEPFDLLILDWMLPQQSGIEVCQQLRSQGDTTPVLFLTAKDTLDERVQGLDVGADDYLVKPFELRELLARVRALLRRGELLNQSLNEQSSESAHLCAEGLELDQESQLVYRNGRMITLSEKESQLLAYFMSHPQQLLTHEDIYQKVWTQEERPSSNALAAHIRLLRRKIEESQDTLLIHTIYGKGYRFGTYTSNEGSKSAMS
jgi:two-component system, OmpR family, manganese sensing response regulator